MDIRGRLKRFSEGLKELLLELLCDEPRKPTNPNWRGRSLGHKGPPALEIVK